MRAWPFLALRDYLVGEMTYRWLATRRHEQRSPYPQPAAPAFDQNSVTLAVYGRIRVPTRCVEAWLFGPPRRRAVCRIVKWLEMRDYPMLMASRGAIPTVD
ncbi:MAG TPA: hypothetical protein VFO69_06935 [Allosphingosinicella sp.]|nr:hypothetical protein [Allosphingosinicella sp.]